MPANAEGSASMCWVWPYTLLSCQKAHWKKHKPHCLQNVQCLNVFRTLGPDYTVRVKPLRRWAEDFGGPIALAAISALNIMNDPECIANHIFIIYIDFLGTAVKAPYTHDVVDAEVLSVNDFTRKVDPPDREPFLRTHTPLPGKIRVLLRDLRFPWSHPMNVLLPPANAVRRLGLDPFWFEHLQIAVTRTGQIIRPREAVEVVQFVPSMTSARRMTVLTVFGAQAYFDPNAAVYPPFFPITPCAAYQP
ncbi:hypothetical protein C8R44DRAFT_890587 [Mycena epipterygia]|nr:hypothetical protein C8R44DRAFT_890587 [Mycena epipterygia]